MVYHHLYAKFAKKDCVRVGVIGAGAYGTAIITQDPYTPLMTVVAIADISLEAAKGAYLKAGLDPTELRQCATADEAQAAIEARPASTPTDPRSSPGSPASTSSARARARPRRAPAIPSARSRTASTSR